MTSKEDVVKAVQDGDAVIVIEGEIAGQIYRIIVTKEIAWAVCGAAIAVAAVSVGVTIGSGGSTTPATAPAAMFATATAATTLGGISTATTAIGIAAISGGVGVLNKLRGYRAEKISDDKVILYKK